MASMKIDDTEMQLLQELADEQGIKVETALSAAILTEHNIKVKNKGWRVLLKKGEKIKELIFR